MKKLLFILFTILALNGFFAHVHVFAISPTPTSKTSTASSSADTKSALGDKLNSEINQLKEKIASRVSELNLVEKRGIIGTISEVKANQITMIDVAGNSRNVDVDEITKFSSPSAKSSFGLSDLTKGTKVSILGLYNKQSKRILARFISTSVDPVFLSGAITVKDPQNFTITVLSENQKQTKIDVQNTTKILTEKDGGLSTFGFSKLEVGDRIFVIGYPDKSDPKLVIGSRIVDLPTLPKNAKIVIPDANTSSDSAVTQTPAGTGIKKVTPVR